MLNSTKNTVFDGAIGGVAITSPMWWPTLEDTWTFMEGAGAAYMLLGAALLLTLRILIAWKEWRRE